MLAVAGPTLASAFIQAGLIDEYRLVVHPVMLGHGKPFFPPIETALRLDPNHADTYAWRTDLLVMEGRPLEAIESAKQALRLNPYPLPGYYWAKGEAEYAARQYENAVATLRHAATYGTPSRSILAAALAQLGRLEEARIEGRLFMADYPDFRIESFLDTQPFRHRADREHFAEGYRKAALPE